MFIRLSSITVWLSLVFIPTSLVHADELRTWVDSSGSYRVEAEFVAYSDETVTLRNAKGREVKVPFSRLSKKDQEFIRQQDKSSDGADDKKLLVGKPATAKPVVKRFYWSLIDQDFDAMKALVTPDGQSDWDAAKTKVEELDAPDGRQAVLVRKAIASDDVVNVNVSIKVRGKYLKYQVRTRWIDGEWRVAAIIPDDRG